MGLEVVNGDILLQELSNKFYLTSSQYNPTYNQLDFSVQLPTNDTGEILAFLANKANINQFVETIPSANEIFIQTVQSEDANE